MKKRYFLFFILGSLIISCKEKSSKDAKSPVRASVPDDDSFCDLMEQFLKDFQKSEHQDSIFLKKEFVKWNESLYFDFKVNGISWLPKSDSERIERLSSSELIDPYPILFLFAFPCTDSLFNETDRTYMRSQIFDSIENCTCVDRKVMFMCIEEEKAQKKVAITKPLFSVDKRRVAFVVYSDYSYNDSNIHGIVQNVYYVKTPRGWHKIFSTPKWIL